MSVDDKSGSPDCGLYVRVSDYSDMPDLITKLRQMAMVINRASGYEKNMHGVELVFERQSTEKIADLITIMQAQGLVCIVSHCSLEEVQSFKEADGFLLNGTDDLALFRKELGEHIILGMDVGQSKEAALQAINENMADYVVVGARSDLIGLFAAQDNVLVCASGAGVTNDNAGSLVRAGANFIECSDYILAHEKGAMQGTVNMLHAIELSLGEQERAN